MGAPLAAQQLKEFVQNCLNQGYKQAEIAVSLDMDPGDLSKFCAIHGLTPAANDVFAPVDQLYVDIEKQALEQLQRLIGTVGDPMKLLRIATGINATKRRSIGGSGAIDERNTTTVNLTLPTSIAAQFVFNAQGQAVAYEGGTEGLRPLVTVTNEHLQRIASEHAAAPTKLLEVRHEPQPKHATTVAAPAFAASVADDDM